MTSAGGVRGVLPHPEGVRGLRPIGLLTTIMRVVERVHSKVFCDWERRLARPYDRAAAGAGGAEDAMWEQMLLDEGLEDGGEEVSATAVLDLEQALCQP